LVGEILQQIAWTKNRLLLKIQYLACESLYTVSRGIIKTAIGWKLQKQRVRH
jgi:hypothetical protein